MNSSPECAVQLVDENRVVPEEVLCMHSKRTRSQDKANEQPRTARSRAARRSLRNGSPPVKICMAALPKQGCEVDTFTLNLPTKNKQHVRRQADRMEGVK